MRCLPQAILVFSVFIYRPSPQYIVKRRDTVQTRLTDFLDPEEGIQVNPPETPSRPPPKPSLKKKVSLWTRVIEGPRGEWGVCNFDGTVLLVRIADGRIHTHGEEAVCKWCESPLEIRDSQVFCTGECKRYQGDFSSNLNAFLWWEGVKSYTVRKAAAEVEAFDLEERDLEPMSYAPNWSVLYEYMADQGPEEEIAHDSKP